MKIMRKAIIFALLTSGVSGCGMLAATNEDAGFGSLASHVTVPVNGELSYSIRRSPNMSDEARQWDRDKGVNRSFFGWFGSEQGPKADDSGSTRMGGRSS